MFSEEWNKILSEVSNFQSDSSFTWYRGQNNSNYLLNSGLYREEVSNLSSYIATEKNYYNMFNRMGYIHHKEKDWNLLFIMQHYGVKTRLLDWTESFPIALFFAIQNYKPKNNCSVWMLNPLRLNQKTFGEPKYYVPQEKYEDLIADPETPGFNENSLALYPIRNTARIISQQGMFTLQGKKGVPLDQEYDGKLLNEGIIKKIEIKSNLLPDAKKYLKLSNINSFTIFPDLDGLAKYINNMGLFRTRDKQEIIK